jgi:hypothetical protein
VATQYGDERTLGSLLDSLEQFNEDLIVFTLGDDAVSCNSLVILVEDEDDAPEGGRYLLEIFLMKEVLEIWKDHRNGVEPTTSQKCEAIIYYASRDAYIPVEEEFEQRPGHTG